MTEIKETPGVEDTESITRIDELQTTISKDAIRTMQSVLDIVSGRGAFKAVELTSVGSLFDYLCTLVPLPEEQEQEQDQDQESAEPDSDPG